MDASLLDEVRGVDLRDARLNRRLGIILESFAATPTLSIPAAAQKRAELEAVYRFCRNPNVSPNEILKGHFAASRERIAQCQYVLLVQDTTELDLTRPSQHVRGAGPLDSESRRGAFLHPLIAYTGSGLPLGMAWQKNWSRERIQPGSRAEKTDERKQIAIEEKESVRWLEGLRAAREVAESCPGTTCVCVGDSECDIYELFSEPRSISGPAGQVHILVRSCQERTTDDESTWLKKAREATPLFTCTVKVSARKAKIAAKLQGKRKQSREKRMAEVEVRATTVTLRPPQRLRGKLPNITLNVVLVEEPNPPEGCEPIQWLLVTSLPIGDAEKVQNIVNSYCVRWQIEIFFRTLKSGCRVEARQFETLDRLMNCLAVYAIVAWRIVYLTQLGRDCPDVDCEVVFEPCEWKAVYVTLKHEEPPAKPPRLNEMIRMIASLGGYVNRKNTQPGPQTLWIGLQRVHDLATAWNEFGPGTKIFLSRKDL
jgi:hypothetical protein